MDEKLSLQAVEEYSITFANKVAEGFFSKNPRIRGKEILSLCDTRQVNLFVIRELLKAWRQETQKYKSPYFDYDAKEVKEALGHFQNILSNHIAIAKDHFLPILKKATSLTIYLVLAPYDFYADTLDKHGKGTVRVSDLKNEIKYTKINQKPLEALVQRLEQKGLQTISGNEAFALLDQVLEEVNFTPEDIDPFIAEMSKVHPLALEKLYEKKAMPTARPEPASQKPIVNEQIQKEAVTTIADDFAKISHLRNRLTINQKFMFTKMLFNGDFDQFNNTITQIDSFNSLDEAHSYLDAHYSTWDKTTEEYEEFIELVTNRFS